MPGWTRAIFALLRRRAVIYTVVGLAALAVSVAIGGAVVSARGLVGTTAGTLASTPGQSGTTLSATKTATAHWNVTYGWTIDKSVTPATWDLFTGDTGTSKYTISVTKDNGVNSYFVDGEICVTNGGAVATENLTIVDNLTAPPSSTVLNSLTVDVSAKPSLGPGESNCYPYTITIPNPVLGQTYKDTADVTITNHSGHLGDPFGPNPSATSDLPRTSTPIHGAIHVSDTNGGSFPFSASGSTTYDQTFGCGTDAGSHSNIATIHYDDDGNGPSDSASVQVNCYALTAAKSASTSLTRTYSWQVVKQADQALLTLERGQTFVVNYQVTANMLGSDDSDWAVNGTITVSNPAPVDARINSVTDVISDGVGAATVGICTVDGNPITLPGTLPAGKTLICAYSRSLSNAASHTNTATATLQNYSYDSDHAATLSGTTDFTGSAGVVFDQATLVHGVHTCINVTDSYAGNLGTVCSTDLPLPKVFTYSRTVGPYSACGDQTVDNTAAFVATDDVNVTGSSSWTVMIHVPCNGCTLTIGYWKTHAGGVGKNADVVSAKLPISLGSGGGKTVVVMTASQAITILSMNGDASNGINKLYAQLLGAKLSIAYGADPSAVSSTIAAADGFLTTHNAADWNSLTKAQKAQVLSWATTLDNYNNGLIGPGHCSQ